MEDASTRHPEGIGKLLGVGERATTGDGDIHGKVLCCRHGGRGGDCQLANISEVGGDILEETGLAKINIAKFEEEGPRRRDESTSKMHKIR